MEDIKSWLLRTILTSGVCAFALTLVWIPAEGVIYTFLVGGGLFNGEDTSLWLFFTALNGVFLFLLSFLLSSHPWASTGKWACPIGYLPLGLKQVDFVVSPEVGSEFVLKQMLLLLPLLASFFGGDLGDRKRIQRERERMKAESDALDVTVLSQQPQPLATANPTQPGTGAVENGGLETGKVIENND